MPGNDFCDMAGDYGRDPSDFSIVNVMLPRSVLPGLAGQRARATDASVATQLQGDGMDLDYDQLLAKQPYKDDAVFAWHQDMAYWPDTPDTRTATMWLRDRRLDRRERVHALRSGYERRGSLRHHEPVFGGRGESHALGTALRVRRRGRRGADPAR